MTNIIIKISNFVHYFYREGGCLNCEPIFTIQSELKSFPLFFWIASLNRQIGEIENSLKLITLDPPQSDFLYERVCLRVLDHFQTKNSHTKF